MIYNYVSRTSDGTGSLDADSVYPYPYPSFLEYLNNDFVINRFPI